jgi:hypothetical protein
LAGVDSLDNGNKRSGSMLTGATLAAARATSGLALVDIARETRVPLRHLAAIERDEHDGLPALPYATGFVKSYARAVGLDPAVMAAQFRSETSKSPHEPTPRALAPLDERRMPARSLAVTSLLVVVAIIAGLSAWGAGLFDPPLPATDAPEIASAGVDQPARIEGSDGIGIGSAGTTDGGVTGDGAIIGAGAAAPATGADAQAAVRGPVVLTAREAVWLKIFDPSTKTTARVGIMSAGERYEVPAQPPGMKLWTGKAGAFDVTVGGRAVPPLGGTVETVRDLSLAPADLLARVPGDGAGAGAATQPAGPRPIAERPRPRPAPPPAAVPDLTGSPTGVSGA